MFNNTDKRYNQFSAHLKNKFGVKVYKITLDAGFSCPNRDGTISTGGCIFCDEGGSFSQAHSNLLSISEQIQEGIKTLSTRFKAEKFMSYFQAYSNTYKPVKELEKIYNSSLCDERIVGLSIGTRPDCVDDEKLKARVMNALNYGVDFLSRYQVKEGEMRGGIPTSAYWRLSNASEKSKVIRIDNVQHALSAWITYKKILNSEKI